MKLHTSSKKTMEPTGTILQIKVSLLESYPLIWRRVLIPSDFNLSQLHEVLQIVMGWQNKHLYRFDINGQEYGEHEAEFEDEIEIKSAPQFTLSDVAGKSERFVYSYDFGDDWQHEVVIEKSFKYDENYNYPICIGGENACPPEDCGGVPGYVEFLKHLLDEDDGDHLDTKAWIGGFFDPKTFDPNRINQDHLWQKKWLGHH